MAPDAWPSRGDLGDSFRAFIHDSSFQPDDYTIRSEATPEESFAHEIEYDASTTHITLVPGDPRYCARTYPAVHHGNQSLTPEEAEFLVETSQQHYALLRDAGIDVPVVYYSTETKDVYGNTILYAIVERVEGTRFTDPNGWPALGIAAPNQEQAIQLARGLIKYYSEAMAEGVFFGEIGLHQCRICSDGRVSLIDTDPQLYSIRSTAGKFNLGISLHTLYSWTRCIQPPEVGRELSQQVTALQAQALTYNKE